MSAPRTDEQLQLLLRRTDELCDRAARGAFAATRFLTPREAKCLSAHLSLRGQGHRARLHGGYAAAERVCLLLFPDYVIEACDPTPLSDVPVADLLSMVGEDDPVAAARIRGSDWRTLSHRDYLGSLLSLGLEREVLGDIAMDGNHATLFCSAHILPFLQENLTRIGGDAVKIEPAILPPDFDGGRKFVPLQDTVASARLDCVVAALGNLSREAAGTTVKSGLVELDYEVELRPDRTVEAPCIISVRGVGKFRVTALGDLTRKGRLRLMAEKYV